jgi:hypothetical protein
MAHLLLLWAKRAATVVAGMLDFSQPEATSLLDIMD